MHAEDLDEVPEAMAVERTLSSQEATVAHHVVALCQCVINDKHKPSMENLLANQTSRLECESLQAQIDKIAKNIDSFLEKDQLEFISNRTITDDEYKEMQDKLKSTLESAKLKLIETKTKAEATFESFHQPARTGGTVLCQTHGIANQLA